MLTRSVIRATSKIHSISSLKNCQTIIKRGPSACLQLFLQNTQTQSQNCRFASTKASWNEDDDDNTPSSSNMKDLLDRTEKEDGDENENEKLDYKQSQRIWKPYVGPSSPSSNSNVRIVWTHAVDQVGDSKNLKDLLERIGIQEREGGRMRQSQLGVIREDPVEDMRLLIENFTVPALASALRDREEILQLCANLLAENKLDELSKTLRPFESRFIKERRRRKNKLAIHQSNNGGFDTHSLEMLRRGLMRMPRRVSQAHQKRAGVVLPLCNVDGVPCILFEKRSRHLRAHPDEVCLPGGMVSAASDISIVSTCLREMAEEIEGIDIEEDVTVLGVLRCNWGEVHHLTGVAVTPVVCFIGEIGDKILKPNPDEVAECFTVPLAFLLDRERWVHREDYAPIFIGGPHVIWGLTGYIVERFIKDVLARYSFDVPPPSPTSE